LQWQVIGIDKDGFEIPPLYANPIFSKAELLAAPKLKTPEIRQPANQPNLQPETKPKNQPGAYFKILKHLFALSVLRIDCCNFNGPI
jgi:hypothetical protein